MGRWTAVLILLTVAIPATATAAGVATPSAGAVLTSGDTVEVCWTELPAGTDELELQPCLGDGGASVRRTGELAPEGRCVPWRGPALPSDGARLAARFNRGRGEEAGSESGRFSIAADRRARLANVAIRGPELWLTGLPLFGGPRCATAATPP